MLRRPYFQTIGRRRWSALGTGRLYHARNISGTNCCCRLCRFQGHRTEGRIISMRNSSNTIRNRTRDLPACCAMPQPTAAPRFYQGNSRKLPRHVKYTRTHEGYLHILCSNQVNPFRFVALKLKCKHQSQKRTSEFCLEISRNHFFSSPFKFTVPTHIIVSLDTK